VLTYFDMGRLHERLERAFADWGSAQRGVEFTLSQCERVVKVLEGNTQLVTVAAGEAEDDDAKIEDLTRQQYETFRDVLSRNRVRVLGKAGSGKTMLAVWTAQALASVGDSVLFLCFNRLLPRWVSQRYELPEEVRVRSYHALCREYATKAGIPFNPLDAGDEAETFWAEQSPSILVEAIDILGNDYRFDSIIVDEAQDFHKDWWISIQLLLQDMTRGHFYLFYDPDQSGLYGHGQAYPAEVSHVRTLDVNCRNTKRIARYCGEVIRSPMQSFQRAPEGISPTLLSPIPLPAQRVIAARDAIKRWLQEGFRPSQIAILSPWRRGNPSSVLTHLTSVADHPIRGEDEDLLGWMSGDCIWGSTIKAFKGLEADCLLLTDLPSVNATGFSRSELYVAASRAKLHLSLLPSSDAAYAELESWLATIGNTANT
jgi:superfamily I DNA/RNA helicase